MSAASAADLAHALRLLLEAVDEAESDGEPLRIPSCIGCPDDGMRMLAHEVPCVRCRALQVLRRVES